MRGTSMLETYPNGRQLWSSPNKTICCLRYLRSEPYRVYKKPAISRFIFDIKKDLPFPYINIRNMRDCLLGERFYISIRTTLPSLVSPRFFNAKSPRPISCPLTWEISYLSLTNQSITSLNFPRMIPRISVHKPPFHQ